MKRWMIPAFVWTLCVQVLNLGGQFIVDILIARLLGPAIAGEFIFAFSISGMLSIFILFGAGEVAIKLYNQREHPPQTVLSAMLVIWGAGTLGCALVATVLLWALNLSSVANFSVIAALVVLSINGLSALFNHAIVSFDASSRDVGAIVSSRVVMVIGVVVMAHVGSIAGVWAVYILSALVQLVYRALVVHRHLFAVTWSLDRQVLAQVWRRGRHLGLSSVFGTISTRADMPILRALAGNVVTGLYGAAYRIVSGVTMLSGSLAFALFPYLNRTDRHLYRWHRRLFVVLPLLGGVVMWVVAWWWAESIMVLCFGEPFRASGQMLRWLLIAASFQCQQAFLARYMIAAGYERVMPYGQGLAAIVNISALFLLVPSMGAMGAVWATVAGDLVNLLVLIFVAAWVGLDRLLKRRRVPSLAPVLASAQP